MTQDLPRIEMCRHFDPLHAFRCHQGLRGNLKCHSRRADCQYYEPSEIEQKQDELAGIKTGVVEIICEACLPYICAYWNKPASERIEACRPLKNWVERWFALTVSSGGGRCSDCGGSGHPNSNYPSGRGWMTHCLNCNGTGQKPIVTKELREIIKEATKDVGT